MSKVTIWYRGSGYVMSLSLMLQLTAASVYASNPEQQSSLSPYLTKQANAQALLNDYYILRFKSPDAARMILVQALEKYPTNFGIQAEFAYLVLKEGNLKEALVHLKLANAIEPYNTDIAMQIAYILISLRKNDEAIFWLRRVVNSGISINQLKAMDALKKLNHPVTNELPVSAQKKPANLLMITTRKQVTSGLKQVLFPTMFSYLKEMAPYNTIKNSNPLKARKILEHILDLHWENFLAQKEIGIILLKEGNLQDAIVHLRQAYATNPEDDELLLLIGDVFSKANQYNLATAYYKQALTSPDLALRNKAQQALETLKTTKPGTIIPLDNKSLGTLHAMDLYFTLKKNNPTQAKKILEEIIYLHPESSAPQIEMGYLLLQEKQTKEAINSFLTAHKLDAKNDAVTLQLAYLYASQGNRQEASLYFKEALASSDPKTQAKAREGLLAEHPRVKTATIATLSPMDKMMNQYFILKKTNEAKAQRLLSRIIARYPDNIMAIKEMGQLLLKEKKDEQAMRYFIRAYERDPRDYPTAAQIGYLMDSLGRKREAFAWFKRAFETNDPLLKQSSYASLINLGSQAHQFLPSPWFADLWSSPFSYSRFNLAVIPEHLRIGRSFGKKKQYELYFNNYVNKDNRSRAGSVGQLPSIFEDNYVLIGGGARYYTQTKIPLTFFVEIGRAYDLVPRNRDRWQNDYRGGVLADKSWTTMPNYAEKLKFPFIQVGDFYGDSTWFSRYEDWISFARVREGTRFLQYKNLSLIAYARLFLILDSKKYFYNNLYEYGPGMALIPNNTWPISLRFERRFGHYIPVNSPDPNPYGPSYTTNVAMLEFNYRV